MPVQQIAKTNTTIMEQPNTPQQKEEEFSIDLVEMMYRLLAGWKLILCLAICFAIIAAVYTIFFVTPLYRATSVVYVLSPDSILNMSNLQFGTALTHDYIKVFDLWEVHEEVKSNLGLNYSYSKMKKMLSVTNTSGTRMLDISFSSPSAKEAADVANEYARVASEYIADTMSTDKPNIMSMARMPANPYSPSKTRNIAVGFLLGAFLGAAIIILQTLMDDKLKTAEDIRQYTGLVTLAVVPILEEDDEEPGKKQALGKNANNHTRRKA